MNVSLCFGITYLQYIFYFTLPPVPQKQSLVLGQHADPALSFCWEFAYTWASLLSFGHVPHKVQVLKKQTIDLEGLWLYRRLFLFICCVCYLLGINTKTQVAGRFRVLLPYTLILSH